MKFNIHLSIDTEISENTELHLPAVDVLTLVKQIPYIICL